MKGFTLFLITLTSICFVEPAMAVPPDVDPGTELRERIVQLISRPHAKILHYAAERVDIEFLVTHQRKLVVLEVRTGNPKLSEFVMDHLNYKRVGVRGVEQFRIYNISVTFLKSEGEVVQ